MCMINNSDSIHRKVLVLDKAVVDTEEEEAQEEEETGGETQEADINTARENILELVDTLQANFKSKFKEIPGETKEDRKKRLLDVVESGDWDVGRIQYILDQVRAAFKNEQ